MSKTGGREYKKLTQIKQDIIMNRLAKLDFRKIIYLLTRYCIVNSCDHQQRCYDGDIQYFVSGAWYI